MEYLLALIFIMSFSSNANCIVVVKTPMPMAGNISGRINLKGLDVSQNNTICLRIKIFQFIDFGSIEGKGSVGNKK